MSGEQDNKHNPLTAAANSVAVVIAINKPVYPLYVWWLAGDIFNASLLTIGALPFYAALPFIAKKSGISARVGLVLIGTCDTIAITKYMGEATGAWLFLAACLMLAAMSFYEVEK